MKKIIAKVVESNLESMFPDIKGICKQGDYVVYLGNAAEGGKIDGLSAADYYGEFRGGYPWINEKLKEAIEGMGYLIEWYDPGTLIAYGE